MVPDPSVRLRKLGLSFLGLALATLAVVAYLSHRNWQQFRASTIEAERTRHTLSVSERVLELMRDAETGQRGFLLTGRAEYLEPYHQAANEVPRRLRELDALTGRLQGQRRHAGELDSLAAEKLQELQKTIELRRRAGMSAVLPEVLSGRGKQVMDRLREVSHSIQAEAYHDWRTSYDALQHEAQQTRILTLSGALLLTVLLCIALLALRKSAAQRERLIEQLDAALQSSEEARGLFRTTLYSIGDGVITTDRAGKITMLNAVAVRLTGYTEEEAFGREIEDVFHIVDDRTRAAVESPVRSALAEGRVVGLANHTVLISKSGIEVPLDDSGAPILGHDGTVNGVVLVFRDVTARKRAEEALVQSERRFRSVADAAPVMIWQAGADRRFTYVNKTWLDFTGHTAEAALGGRWTEAVHAEDRAHCQELYAGSFEQRVPFSVECRLRRYDGQPRWVLAHGVPLFGPGGEFSGFLGSVVDIEDRRRAEEKMRQAAKLESLGVLAGGIAHDFNNLLVGILGGASLLADYVPVNSVGREILGNLIQCSERAAQLTTQMLAYSGHGRFVVEPFNLSEQVPQILSLIRASIPKHVEIRLSLDPVLPEIEADAAQMQQLLMNLVINAAEAVAPQRGWVQIATGTEDIGDAQIAASQAADRARAGEHVVLTVTDSGTGMDEATKSRIFDPFFSTKFTGRGLGLAAVLGIVRGHRGGIEVLSSPGQGSTFRVFFPVAGACRQAPAPAPEPLSPGKGKILVVDDEDIVRRVARSGLENAGYEVVVASDGREAIDALARERDSVVLVILDLTMPVLSGEDALPRLRELSPKARIVASSGFGEREAIERFGSVIDGFIHKPYTAAQLVRRIQALLAPEKIKRAGGAA